MFVVVVIAVVVSVQNGKGVAPVLVVSDTTNDERWVCCCGCWSAAAAVAGVCVGDPVGFSHRLLVLVVVLVVVFLVVVLVERTETE